MLYLYCYCAPVPDASIVGVQLKWPTRYYMVLLLRPGKPDSAHALYTCPLVCIVLCALQ